MSISELSRILLYHYFSIDRDKILDNSELIENRHVNSIILI